MSAPTVLIGYGPDLQESGVWFGPPNCVSRRGWLPCELSLLWVLLPDPRSRPIPGPRFLEVVGNNHAPAGSLTLRFG